MKRVLVTGASGFIGRHCPPLLKARGYEVHALSSRRLQGSPRADAHGDFSHRVDLHDASQVELLLREVRPTHLLHLAWLTTPGVFWNAPQNLDWVRASLHLLRCFAENGGQRVVTAGTCAEYSWNSGMALCREETTLLAPESLYGTCKHALQMMQAAFAREAEMSAAWGRLFFLFGPHEPSSKLVASTIRALLRDEPALCSQGNQIRDFLYVEDAAAAFVALLDSEIQGAVNIASGQGVALKVMVQEIAGQLDKRDLVRLGARPAPVGEPAYLVGDVRRLQGEVNWGPRYDLGHGMARTIAWWRENLEMKGET